MALTLKHATPAQVGAAFRERFRAAHGVDAARLGAWLMDRIDDGTWTDTQARVFFGLTVGQWASLKAKLNNWRTAFQAAAAALGE